MCSVRKRFSLQNRQRGCAHRLLQRVGDVGGDGAASVAHPDEVARVDDQVCVPEHRAALADEDVWVACTHAFVPVSLPEPHAWLAGNSELPTQDASGIQVEGIVEISSR